MDFSALNRQFISGGWIDGGENDFVENLNPYDDSLINSFKAAGKTDVDKAFAAAKETSKSWSITNPIERRNVMLKAAAVLVDHQEEIIDWLIKEAGSTRLKAQVEFAQSYDMILEAASFPTRMHGKTINSAVSGKDTYVIRKALGVVAVISPWNFPLYLSMRSVAPALAVGNAVVIKPASQTPVTGGTLIAKIFEEAGLPAGALNVVVGKSAVIGDYFTGHPESRLVSFTGSTPVGKGIGKIGGEGLKKLALELGGNNAFLILEDADVDKAVNSAIFGRFMHQGQICMSTNRILIHESLAAEFTAKFTARAQRLPVGDPGREGTVIGPLIDGKAVKRVLDLIDRTVKAGAKLETGGSADGNVVLPAVLSGITPDMPIFREEVFGPAVGIATFRTDDEAVDLANATEFGLSGALHTRDIGRGIKIAKRIETGMIHINDQSVNDEPSTPFGGEKNSGVGRFGDEFIIDEMTTVQWISVQAEERQYPF
jgi:acyl-CoA reductase-like NAD-dependent aldehyde dehydrogenase